MQVTQEIMVVRVTLVTLVIQVPQVTQEILVTLVLVVEEEVVVPKIGTTCHHINQVVQEAGDNHTLVAVDQEMVDLHMLDQINVVFLLVVMGKMVSKVLMVP